MGGRQEEGLNPCRLCSSSHTSEAGLKPCDPFLWKKKDICRHFGASWPPVRGWRHGEQHPGTGWGRPLRAPRSARCIPPSPQRTPAFLSFFFFSQRSKASCCCRRTIFSGVLPHHGFVKRTIDSCVSVVGTSLA